MSYKSFDDNPNKIRESYNESVTNANNIETEKTKIQKLKPVVKYLNVNSNKTKYDFSTEWTYFAPDTEEDYLENEWIITFNKIPNKLIPFIRFEPIYEVITGNASNPSINHIFRVIDYEIDGGTTSKIELRVGMQLSYSGSYSVRGKVLVKITNPELYI